MRTRYTCFLLISLLMFIGAEYLLLNALYQHLNGYVVLLAASSMLITVLLLVFCYRKLSSLQR